MVLTVTRAWLVLLILALYGVLNKGFMLLRIPPGGEFGIPAAELLVLMFAATFVFEIRRVPSFAAVAPVTPLLVLWLVGAANIVLGVVDHGIWALRDASHMVDTAFLWIGFVVAASPGFSERFSRWLRVFLNVCVAYSLLFPFRETLKDYSPKIHAPAGYDAPLLFNYVSTSVLPVTAAVASIADRVSYFGLPTVVLVGALIVYTAVIFQARTTYLEAMALVVILAYLRPADAMRIMAGTLIGLSVLSILVASGLEITGRLGEAASFAFFVEHFASIWGVKGSGNIAGAAEGVPLRLRWWTLIWQNVTASFSTLLFGLGYGDPLTDFFDDTNAIVREPHNSYISMFARVGVVGLTAFILVHLSLIRTWYRVYKSCERDADKTWRNNMLIMGTFFLMIGILSLGEDGFEKPFNAALYYFFSGVILRAAFSLRAGNRASDLAGVACDRKPAQAPAGATPAA